MKRLLFALAALSALVGNGQAQDRQHSPWLYSLAYSHPMDSSWGLRGAYGSGLYADWFPFGSGFRLVGGIGDADMKVGLQGFRTAGVNSDSSGFTGNFFNPRVKYLPATYLGVGYGHQGIVNRGLGFYADLGVTLGTFSSGVNSSVPGLDGPAVLPYFDAQRQGATDSLAGLRYLPSVSLGLFYRY